MKEVIGARHARALERHGWTLRRVYGSDRIYGRSGSEVRMSVPIHGSRLLKKGLLHHLLKLAGLAEGDV